MAARLDRAAGDVIRQSPQSRRRSLLDLKHFAPSDEIATDSESIYSDEKEIFNALVVRTPSRDSRGYETMCQMGPIMEEGLAANLAMFIPTRSSSSSPPVTAHHYGRKKERKKADTAWWRHQALSDQSSNRPKQLSPIPMSETRSTAETTQGHCKATSLDTVKASERTSNWPAKPGPAVLPNQPQYPPPERIPTPPGLPSFNTPEAVLCSARFLARPDGGRFYAQRNAAGAEGASSRGDAFRRLLGFPSSVVDARPSTQSAVGIGRADDGTIVHGRFPYRQSGHNANMARQIHDHPFLQNTLPIAEANGAPGTEDRSTKDADVQPRQRARDYLPPSLGRWRFQDSPVSSTPESPATPRSGLTDRVHSFLGNSRGSNRPDASNGIQFTNHQGIDTALDRLRSHHSRLQSVQSIDDGNDSDDSDQDLLPEGTHSTFDILFWLPVQIYLCCLVRTCSFPNRRGDVEALDTTNSNDTYVTAQSRPSDSTTHSAQVRGGTSRSGKLGLTRWVEDSWSRVSSQVVGAAAPRR